MVGVQVGAGGRGVAGDVGSGAPPSWSRRARGARRRPGGPGADVGVHDSDRFFAFPVPGWFVVLGEESTRLVWWRRGADAFAVVEDLPRISSEGRYDPGGFYRASFFPVPDACVVATKECVALLHRDAGLVWTHVHADVTTRVEAVGPHAVVLVSEDDRSTLDLASGKLVASEPLDWSVT